MLGIAGYSVLKQKKWVEKIVFLIQWGDGRLDNI